MEEKIEFKTIWHESGVSALVLAAVCVGYFLLSNAVSGTSKIWLLLLVFLLEIAKIVFCIVYVKRCMTGFKAAHPSARRRDVYRLGMMVGLISGLIIAAASMAYYQFNPQVISDTFNTMLSAMPQGLDRNALNMIESMEQAFPRLAFFSQFIYCAIWAFVLPAFIAPSVVSDNPFDNDDDDDEE